MYIDKLGRKPVLVVGAIGMASCHFIIAAIYGQNEDKWDSNPAAGWAAVCMVWLFVVHFGYSWGPCSWILIAEIWPISVRAKGVALGASASKSPRSINCASLGYCQRQFTYVLSPSQTG